MTTLLQINASINKHTASPASSPISSSPPSVEVIPHASRGRRDVAAAEPVPHLTAERFGAFIAKPEARTAAQHAVVAYSDMLIDELKQADVIVSACRCTTSACPRS